jgi:hypothetical protein
MSILRFITQEKRSGVRMVRSMCQYSAVVICLCLVLSVGVKTAWSEQRNQGLNETKLHTIYQQGLALYKLGTSSPTDIRFFKEAITHNFQATVNAIKLADKKLVIYPHDKNILGIRALLIKALKIAESK